MSLNTHLQLILLWKKFCVTHLVLSVDVKMKREKFTMQQQNHNKQYFEVEWHHIESFLQEERTASHHIISYDPKEKHAYIMNEVDPEFWMAKATMLLMKSNHTHTHTHTLTHSLLRQPHTTPITLQWTSCQTSGPTTKISTQIHSSHIHTSQQAERIHISTNTSTDSHIHQGDSGAISECNCCCCNRP